MSYVEARFTLGEEFANVWQQAKDNHEHHSQTGDGHAYDSTAFLLDKAADRIQQLSGGR